MDLFRRIWAVLFGTIIGTILGILLDWMSQNGIVPQPTDERYIVYPLIAGGGAFLGALIAAIMIRRPGADTRQSKLDSRPAKPRKIKREPQARSNQQSAKGGSEIGSSKLEAIRLEPVEGMPGFDLEDDDSGSSSASSKEQSGHQG